MGQPPIAPKATSKEQTGFVDAACHKPLRLPSEVSARRGCDGWLQRSDRSRKEGTAVVTARDRVFLGEAVSNDEHAAAVDEAQSAE